MVHHILSNSPNSLQKLWQFKVKDVFDMTMFLVVSYLVSIDHWFLIEHCCNEARISFTVFDTSIYLNIVKKLLTSWKKKNIKRVISEIFFFTHIQKCFYMHAQLTFSKEYFNKMIHV